MTFDELFPYTFRQRMPIPWLSHAGGLTMWGFDVRYECNPHYLTIHARMHVPDREMMRPTSVGMSHIFEVARLRDDPEYARLSVMQWLRDFAMHEVIEGLLVEGKPFYQRELDADHGAESARRK